MGLRISLDSAVPFSPNLNPASALRTYPGLTDGLLAAYQLDLSPDPLTPVAGTETTGGSFSGAPAQIRQGYAFQNNDLIDSQIIPGSSLASITLYAVARRTGVTPSGAVTAADPVCVGPASSAGFRIDLQPTTITAASAFNASQTAALNGDTSVWDFYAFSISGSGCKIYRPRLTTSPATGTATVATIGASQLDSSFRIGSAGTNIKWSQVDVMCAGIFNRQLSDDEVLEQYAAMQGYASGVGVTI